MVGPAWLQPWIFRYLCMGTRETKMLTYVADLQFAQTNGKMVTHDTPWGGGGGSTIYHRPMICLDIHGKKTMFARGVLT